MIDYLLKFPSKDVAIQFGASTGLAVQDEFGEWIANIASHEHSLYEIGAHNGENYWILFRDLVGIPIPPGADQFIYWSSSQTTFDQDGQEICISRPIDDPNIPDIFWA
jgi:hypothetical protein